MNDLTTSRRGSADSSLRISRSSLGLSPILPPANFISVPSSRFNEERAMENSRNRLPEGWISPQSPDEFVIKSRGPRKPIVWSPDQTISQKHEFSLLSLSSRDCSPIKHTSTPNTALKETVRKRLSLNDSRRSVFTTLKVKRPSLDSIYTKEQYNDYLITALRGFRHEQLVQLIMDLIYAEENGELCEDEKLRSVILKKMPIIDVQSLIEKLDILRQNIYSVLLLSPDPSDDSTCSHIYVYLDTFQNTLVSHGTILQESQNWTFLMQYVLAACKIIKDLPKWKTHSSCVIIRKCYKILSNFCVEALKGGNYERSTLDSYIESLENVIKECKDFQICLQLVKEAKQRAN